MKGRIDIEVLDKRSLASAVRRRCVTRKFVMTSGRANPGNHVSRDFLVSSQSVAFLGAAPSRFVVSPLSKFRRVRIAFPLYARAPGVSVRACACTCRRFRTYVSALREGERECAPIACADWRARARR